MNYQEQALAYLHGEMTTNERAAFEEELTRSEALRGELQSARALLDMLDAASEDSIIRMVNGHIQQAIRERASCIYIKPDAETQGQEAETMGVYFRVDGLLHEAARLTAPHYRAIVDRWKAMAGIRLNDPPGLQEGRLTVRVPRGEQQIAPGETWAAQSEPQSASGEQPRAFDLRVIILSTVAGESVAVRIVDLLQPLPALDALGMDAHTLAVIERLVERPRGCVLLAGPNHSEPATFAYSLLCHIQAVGAGRTNIVTVEDDVTRRLAAVSQTVANPVAGQTYADALRGVLRFDPDAVYVAEMRDVQTAQLCVETAAARHLCLSRVNVSSAISAVQRLRDISVDSHLLASHLAGVIGMRLVRRVCHACAAPYEPSRRDLARAGLSLVEDGPFVRGTGCAACRNTGYQGQVGLFEAWEVTPALRALIAERADMDALWNESFGRNGGSLWDDARDKIRQGLVTVEDAAWVLFDYPHSRSGARTSGSKYGVIDLSEL